MNAIAVLYGGRLSDEAFETVFSGRHALARALEGVSAFPGVTKTVLLGADGREYPGISGNIQVIRAGDWTKKRLLECLGELAAGFDLTYFAWADCPFLDRDLAGAMAERHIRYGAEYSYGDGWPYGFAPEILSPGTAAILAKITGDSDGPVERDALFSVIQKDINAFDIETEISPVDLRGCRLTLAADSRRNLLLLTRLAGAGLSGAAGAAEVITGNPELLRTLPAFFPIQVSGPCPQACSLCPYPKFGSVRGTPITERADFMDLGQFESILDSIAGYSGDGVIDLSLWGELSLHPEKIPLIKAVLDRPELSLIIETSGLGWSPDDLEAIAGAAAAAKPRKNRMAPVSWILSLDAHDPGRYREVRGDGYAEAAGCAKAVLGLFPGDTYVQAVRTKGSEDDTEAFYRSWKEAGAQVIIQKYDSFSGYLPDLQASDLSPLHRFPCWHLMRDLPVLIDGTVRVCREDLEGTCILGNLFTDSIDDIWKKGDELYGAHYSKKYPGICADCDEYYTYNF
ncbi:spiro-SPASM protein [Breznakiella homolactica]|uniref:Spiro-SPASM protein n=1 Tax=Breznakiella homolactica TaxID=2798577 RepID=A0A7T7XLE4_9SPIR|nr:spiro-SPASM protein [Breznakiella homolactica]QQO08412.1 spiro-SPASM protein [Breznakiella homolactica]